MALSLRTKFGYGVGHILNDLCSAMWFSYLLIYFHHVLLFPNILAGVILLIGQVADGLSTPFVGHEADRTDDLPFCVTYGRRKTWHLVGTLCVVLTFAFIFLGCLGCTSGSSPWAQVLYFAPFVIVFQFGWACTQISHLAILPNLSSDPHDRTELNAIRYAFTVLSTITVYCITWLILGLTSTGSYSILGPEDAPKFIKIVFIVLCIGAAFSLLFHVLIKEKNEVDLVVRVGAEGNAKADCPPMTWRDWLREPQFYQVAVLYMGTRLFCNLTQVYIPIYLEDTLSLDEQSIAYIPLVMFSAGLLTAFTMKPVNRIAGRKLTFLMGCVLGGIGALCVFFGEGDAFLRYYVYLVAVLLGSGASAMLVTVLSITADMIGSNVECSAFVYGSLSFTDKLSNGMAVMLIQYLTPCLTCCKLCKEFYRGVIGYACGGAVVVAVLALLTLIPTRVGDKKCHQGVPGGSLSSATSRSALLQTDLEFGDDETESTARKNELTSGSKGLYYCFSFVSALPSRHFRHSDYSPLSTSEEAPEGSHRRRVSGSVLA